MMKQTGFSFSFQRHPTAKSASSTRALRRHALVDQEFVQRVKI
jgi:ribosomal protein L35